MSKYDSVSPPVNVLLYRTEIFFFHSTCTDINKCSGGTDLVVALRGTTRGLWFQSQMQPGAINYHSATLFAFQT